MEKKMLYYLLFTFLFTSQIMAENDIIENYQKEAEIKKDEDTNHDNQNVENAKGKVIFKTK